MIKFMLLMCFMEFRTLNATMSPTGIIMNREALFRTLDGDGLTTIIPNLKRMMFRGQKRSYIIQSAHISKKYLMAV